MRYVIPWLPEHGGPAISPAGRGRQAVAELGAPGTAHGVSPARQ
jgi:hypothetical protein